MPEAPPLPDRVTLPLLTLITQQSFDEDYVHVAERRRAEGKPVERPAGGSHLMAAAVIAVFGLLVGTAAIQTSQEAGVNDQSRATLIARISERSAQVSRLQEQIVRLRGRNVGLADRLASVARTEASATARLQRLETTTGFGAVTGEGVRIVVDDAPDGDATQLVRDEDLALLADGLWNAGAEAIAINGQRLTALSAIRNVNVAVHVNTRPLSPPYTVRAIGDQQTLQARLLESTHGQQFYSLVDQLGFVFDVQNEDTMTLPAAQLRPLGTAVAGAAEQNADKRTSEESNS
jgi:uncharacterized protein YlxW (UPF0749 family)